MQVLFNKILQRMKNAKPRSHGNYVDSIELAERIIQKDFDLCNDLESDDISPFTIVFISDGRPSDKHPDLKERRINSMVRLAKLDGRVSFLGMGIGESGSDFTELQLLADTISFHGGDGSFVHAGLIPASISSTLTTAATSMTTLIEPIFLRKDTHLPK